MDELREKEKVLKDLRSKQQSLELRISGMNRENELCK